MTTHVSHGKLSIELAYTNNAMYYFDRSVPEGALTMPLTMLPAGQATRIKSIRGKDDTTRFLANLGFVAGEKVCVVSESGGNLICQVKGARIAIGSLMPAAYWFNVLRKLSS